MKNLRANVREFIPMAAIIVLCLVTVPSAQANTNNNGSNTATATQQSDNSVAPNDNNHQSKAASKPAKKSVLDDEVLESPFSYFRNAFSEEDEAETSPSHDAVMVTVKALVATLLSTIL